jgi:hypothetical protein
MSRPKMLDSMETPKNQHPSQSAQINITQPKDLSPSNSTRLNAASMLPLPNYRSKKRVEKRKEKMQGSQLGKNQGRVFLCDRVNEAEFYMSALQESKPTRRNPPIASILMVDRHLSTRKIFRMKERARK